jgi:hypothetical protein
VEEISNTITKILLYSYTTSKKVLLFYYLLFFIKAKYSSIFVSEAIQLEQGFKTKEAKAIACQ